MVQKAQRGQEKKKLTGQTTAAAKTRGKRARSTPRSRCERPKDRQKEIEREERQTRDKTELAVILVMTESCCKRSVVPPWVTCSAAGWGTPGPELS